MRLLEAAGCRVAFPEAQTCCGQPLANGGYPDAARDLARRTIEIFEPFERVVTPSGSCAAMLRVFVPKLLAGEPDWSARAAALAGRSFELSEFLDRCGFAPSAAGFAGRVAYHPSCHLLRELGVDAAPRRLLAQLPGVDLVELRDAERCCGFGGAFSVKFPELSGAMLADKLAAIEASGAQVVAACDAGCLLHLGGGLSRRSSRVRALHVAELLAAGL